jgi:hypothetical protein
MATKLSSVLQRKKRGPPATGKTPMFALRMAPEIRKAVREWAARQDDGPGESEAMRRLIKRGLEK